LRVKRGIRKDSIGGVFAAHGVFLILLVLASVRTVMCIVSITRPEPRVYQPDPPGLMHDDPRLLPPWRGSSLF
jgi:hypothetical protein